MSLRNPLLRTSQISLIGLALLTGCGAATAGKAPVGDATAKMASDVKTTAFKAGQAKPNTYWWPSKVDLRALRGNEAANPHGDDFDYPTEFEKLDLKAVKADVEAVLKTSQDWWPADYGHYGPLMVRLAWHSAGTYRVTDGRGGSDGGQIRFEPLNSWPDNGNLDKARRLLWPVKSKYGRALSWADLMILAGNVGMESMGFETLGFSGGRVDDWEADLVYWGPEAEMLGSDRFHGDRALEQPLGAAHMGLIYVNPQGPNGNGDPVSAAKDIRTTFARMAMNDEETVALIAGGHTFGKAHGAHDAANCVGVEPAGGAVEAQGQGWLNKCGEGKGADTVTSGLEGAWTSAPVAWTHQYLTFLFQFDWEQHQSPAGATQWRPVDGGGANFVPDAHNPSVRHAPMMLTTDLSLREDPAYRVIAERWKDDPEAFEDAFARAWFKLTHRDLGPRARYVGSEVPEEVFGWQDPVPAVNHALVDDQDVAGLKKKIAATGLSSQELIRTAWAAASTYRSSDMRGGANGARIRLAPQKDWSINNGEEIAKVVGQLESVQTAFNTGAKKGKKVSLADLIVLGGAVGVEDAAKAAGVELSVPFTPGRTDASQDQTDTESFGYLEPAADGFRSFYTDDALRTPADALIDRADLLDLTVPEMTALVGGLRVLGNNAGASTHGVFTDNVGNLSNDFFVNLLDLSNSWTRAEDGYTFEGRDGSGSVKWTATEADLVFGSNSELRVVAEVYASNQDKFASDFAAAWSKVMMADRFDLDR